MSAQKTSQNTNFGGAGIFWTSRADSTRKTTPYRPILSLVRPKIVEFVNIAIFWVFLNVRTWTLPWIRLEGTGI